MNRHLRKSEDELEISPEKVREIIKVSQLPISLEAPIGEEEDSHLGDFIEDQNALPPPRRRLPSAPERANRGCAGQPDAEGKTCIAVEVRTGRRTQSYAGRSRARIQCYPRKNPPDRSQGAAQTATPHPQPQAEGLFRII